jgi:3-hydroxybutyryl-CoA dehydrogenase
MAEHEECGSRTCAVSRLSAHGRVSVTSNLGAAARDADLVSEAVPEARDLNGRVLAQFDLACPPRTIFMTNTSTLLPSQFATASGRGDRLLALHFHLPV